MGEVEAIHIYRRERERERRTRTYRMWVKGGVGLQVFAKDLSNNSYSGEI